MHHLVSVQLLFLFPASPYSYARVSVAKHWYSLYWNYQCLGRVDYHVTSSVALLYLLCMINFPVSPFDFLISLMRLQAMPWLLCLGIFEFEPCSLQPHGGKLFMTAPERHTLYLFGYLALCSSKRGLRFTMWLLFRSVYPFFVRRVCYKWLPRASVWESQICSWMFRQLRATHSVESLCIVRILKPSSLHFVPPFFSTTPRYNISRFHRILNHFPQTAPAQHSLTYRCMNSSTSTHSIEFFTHNMSEVSRFSKS